MFENMGLGIMVGGSIALGVVLFVVQWGRIRRGDLHLRSRWGVGFGELAVLFVGWAALAALVWWGNSLDQGSARYGYHSHLVFVLSCGLALASVLLPVHGRRTRHRLHGRGLSS